MWSVITNILYTSYFLLSFLHMVAHLKHLTHVPYHWHLRLPQHLLLIFGIFVYLSNQFIFNNNNYYFYDAFTKHRVTYNKATFPTNLHHFLCKHKLQVGDRLNYRIKCVIQTTSIHIAI